MKRYAVILGDPPWPYNSRSTWNKSRFGGGVSGHYDVMPVADIAALPVGRDYAAENCALCLWVTGPHLASGIKVIEGWGFRYVTILFCWVKMTLQKFTRLWHGQKLTTPVLAAAPGPWKGPGYYTRSNVELVLLGMRGQLTPAHKDVAQVVLEPHPRADGKIIHSCKPSEIHRRIERLFGDVPRLEVFARVPVPGWDVLGNQLAEGAQTLEPQRTLFDWNGKNLLAGKGA